MRGAFLFKGGHSMRWQITDEEFQYAELIAAGKRAEADLIEADLQLKVSTPHRSQQERKSRHRSKSRSGRRAPTLS